MEQDDLAGWALPGFDPEKALQQLQRALRDAKLSPRGTRWLLQGRELAELTLQGPVLQARLARRPALTPEWDSSHIDSAAGQRRWLDEFRRRLARWEEEA